MIFPVIMYGCESQTIKAEHLRSDAFKLVLEKTLESPLDSKEVNQSILKEINPEYFGRTAAEVPILRPPDAKNLLIGKDPDSGKD